MKERISEIAKGKVSCHIPILRVSKENIEENVLAEKVYKMDISYEVENKVQVKGMVTSSHPRVKVINGIFVGARGKIVFEIDTRDVSNYEAIKGEFVFITNGGEQNIPYKFHVSSSLANNNELISTIEQFAQLVKSDWRSGNLLFHSKDFLNLPFIRNDISMQAVYQGLTKTSDVICPLEQFLVYFKQKEPVSIALEKDCEQIEDCDRSYEITIFKSDFGDVKINLAKENNSFLLLDKSYITAKDFDTEGIYKLTYQIDKEKLHIGKNYTRLLVQFGRKTIPFFITVCKKGEEKKQSFGEKKELIHITNMLLEYKSGSYEDGIILGSLEGAIYSYIQRYSKPIMFQLMYVYIKWKQNQEELAKSKLEEIREEILKIREKEKSAYLFYSYLVASLSKGKDIYSVYKLAQKYYSEDIDNKILAIIYLHISLEYLKEWREKIELMEGLYKNGCRSPFLYHEYCMVMKDRLPSTNVLTPFMIQSMVYGIKRQLLNEELIEHLVVFLSSEKKFSNLIYRFLELAYNQNPNKDILNCICTLLVRGRKTSEKYFSWYEKGIKEELRIAGLYDYYLYSLPSNFKKKLPQNILLYYSYNIDMEDNIREIIYGNILEYFGINSQMYYAYEEQMRNFAIENLLRGKISSVLIPLYKQILRPEMIDTHISYVLPDLLYAKKVRLLIEKNEEIYAIVIKYPEKKKEIVSLINQGEVCIPIYTTDAIIFFEDKFGKRYLHLPYEIEAIFPEEMITQLLAFVEKKTFMIQLVECKQLENSSIRTKKQLLQAMEIIKEDDIANGFKHKIIKKVIDYIYCSKEELGCDGLLLQLDFRQLEELEKKKVIEILIDKNYNQEAFQKIICIDFTKISNNYLVRLANNMILESAYYKNEQLIYICRYLVTIGQYNTTILTYLCQHIEGSGKEMYHIFTLMNDNHITNASFIERLFSQLLFTGNIEKIDKVYTEYEKCVKEPNLLIQSYLVLCCHKWISYNGEYGFSNMDWNVAKKIEHIITERESMNRAEGFFYLPDICFIGLLYSYTKLEQLTPLQIEIGTKIFEYLCKKKKYFFFFLKLQHMLQIPWDLNGKTILEVRDKKHKHLAAVVYSNTKKEVILPLQQVYEGIYTTLVNSVCYDLCSYEIINRSENGEEHISDIVLDSVEVFEIENSMFYKINQIKKSLQQNEKQKAINYAAKLEEEQYILNRLLKMIDNIQ